MVRFAQPTFLYIMCCGALLSSMTILFLSFEDADDDPDALQTATDACMAVLGSTALVSC